MEGDQEESKEEPRLRRPKSKTESIHRSLSAADGNNSSKKQKIENLSSVMRVLHSQVSKVNLKTLSGEMAIRRMSSRSNPNGQSRNGDTALESANGVAPKRGMVLPFTPLAMSFDTVNYFVDMPPVRLVFFLHHRNL